MSTCSKTRKFHEPIIITEESVVDLFGTLELWFNYVECSYSTYSGSSYVYNDAREMYSTFTNASGIKSLSINCWERYSKKQQPNCVLSIINRSYSSGATGSLSINNLTEERRLCCERKIVEFIKDNLAPYHFLYSPLFRSLVLILSSILTSVFILIFCPHTDIILNKFYIILSSIFGGTFITLFGIIVIGKYYPQSIICMKDYENFFKSSKRLFNCILRFLLIIIVVILLTYCLYYSIEYNEL